MKTYLYFITAIGLFLLSNRKAAAQSELQGVINQNTTLTADKSPYRVTGDVYVESGVTLTVESGVDLIFWDYYSIFVSGEFKTTGTSSQMVRVYGQQVQGNTFVLWGGIIAQTIEAKITIDYTELSNSEVAVNYSRIQHSGTWTPPQLDIRNSRFSTNFTGIAGHPKGVTGEITDCFFIENAIGFSGLTDTLAYVSKALFMPAGAELENCTFSYNDIGASRALKLSACRFENNRKAAMMEGGQIKNTYFLNNDSGLVTHSSITEDCRFENNRLAYYHLPLNPPVGTFVGNITLRTSIFRTNKRAVYIDTTSYIDAINCNRFLLNEVGLYLPAHFYTNSNTSADSFKITMNTMTNCDTAIYISGSKPSPPVSSPDPVIARFITNRVEDNNSYNFYNSSEYNFNLFKNYLGDSAAIEARLFDGTDDTTVGYVSYGIPASIQFAAGGYTVVMKREVIKSAAGTVVNASSDSWFGQECVS
ncbi:MAG TPA: hypothetical protein VEC12_13435, partial [Bacteroidia bacterium]|nr:hypothetical protein [Bacteroidia bacterium]